MCKSDLSIDIVFTDIQLIGSASGWDVADYVQADRPNVLVLYAWGNRLIMDVAFRAVLFSPSHISTTMS